MSLKLFAFIAAIWLCVTGTSYAQENSLPKWEPIIPFQTSAALALNGWELISSAGLSWPDGRQALVSYWALTKEGNRLTLRCYDYFDADMQSTGGACYQPVE